MSAAPRTGSRFEGRTVLVTGATNGIGRAGARRLAAEGASLVLTGRDPARLDALREELPQARVLADDAADPATGDRLADALDGRPLHGLWLNAGYARVRPPEELDADFIDAMTATNVRGPQLQLARLAPLLVEGGSVVLTSSTGAYEGSPLAGVYAATKGAVVSLARCWASTLGPAGVRVNTLVPGAIDTGFRDHMDDDTKERFEADVVGRTSLGRVGTAEEAAAAALFLLSEDAGYVTGSQHVVDGGLTMR